MSTTSSTLSIRISIVAVGIVLFLVCPIRSAWAQTVSGGIRGTVVDSTQAVIPGVAVIATHVDTGVVRTGETTGEGVYNLAALPGGLYRVEVVHPGMKTAVRENVRVTAASVTRGRSASPMTSRPTLTAIARKFSVRLPRRCRT